jgi:glutamate-1-semialdehyde 2,1-aminomutase
MQVVQVAETRMNALRERAAASLPAGVSASARLNAALGHALYVNRGDGCRIWDVDGREYIDFNLSHGATFLGHNHPGTRAAIEQALAMGIVCAYETEHHAALAEQIKTTIPCAERVRYCNTGSEATLVAIRLARAYTGKPKLLKFWGHFHGLHDGVLYNAHSPETMPDPGPYLPPMRESKGVPAELDTTVIVIPWNDEAAISQALAEHGHEIAAVIMEPINYNQGCLTATTAYLRLVRDLTTKHGNLLIFDEVLSGFRTGPDCAQGYYGVTPDLCTLAKAIANGVPLAVVTGREEIMNTLAPLGGAAQSGTYTAHLFGILAALASLNEIRSPGFYDRINTAANRLYAGLNDLFAKHELPARAQGLGARFGLYFGRTEPVGRYSEATQNDGALAAAFIRACAAHGVYFHSYGKLVIGHHGISASHTLADIDEALARIDQALAELRMPNIAAAMPNGTRG